jgi:hypothetical protein
MWLQHHFQITKLLIWVQEKFEDNKVVIRSFKSKNRQYNGQKNKDIKWSTKHYTEEQTIQWPKEKGHKVIYKTLHRRTDNTMAKRKRT